jgi:nucleotide-binding universal stress UspA family protein
MNQVPHDMVAKARAETAEALEISAAALPGVKTHLASGHPGRYIIDYANENDIDCIIIASHKPGLENFFLGSTANRVVRHARCSVHILR